MSRRRFSGAPGQPPVEVELSNLDKVLYPATGTTKGEVIAYYTAMASAMLPHILDRPATRKRWPNGVDQPAFFEKNLAAHAPTWLSRQVIAHAGRSVTYPVLDSAAALAWIGQQAALEVHVPQWCFTGADIGPANRLVFDLDPGPEVDLADCAVVALAVRDMVAQIGLSAYPVTSGSKGIHVYVPLDRVLSPGGASQVAKQVATNLVSLHPDRVTANMAKHTRVGKVFVDWSQNNPAKTTIAPYSLRGREQPWVAAPRSWAEITDQFTLRQLRFDEVLARYRAEGDLLAQLDQGRLDPLHRYRALRAAEHTPEPVPPAIRVSDAAKSAGDPSEPRRFVIQEHHARRLHWDVRLARGGVLVCWAVPKGPPESPETNRLAVHTEDHPMEYLDFQGTIPKGQYGAGEMTIWDSGTYRTEKWRDDEVIIDLRGTRLQGRYALIRTDGKNWLMHRMRDQGPAGAKPDATHVPSENSTTTLPVFAPMLATAGEVTDLTAAEWSFETKWDGYRLVVELNAGTPVIRSRAGNTVTERYPRIAALAAEFAGHQVVLDGEAVVFDAQGVANLPLFRQDPRRAVLMAFDVLWLDGVSLIGKSYRDRRQVLTALAEASPALLVPEPLSGSGAEALAESRSRGTEGVVAKRWDSRYLPGQRGPGWIKQRNWRTLTVTVGGWRRSSARPFASLLVGVPDQDALVYLGRVGTGFSDVDLSRLAERLRQLRSAECPFHNPMTAAERHDATWVRPELRGRVRYMSWTDGGRLWHPAWLGGLNES